MKRTVSPERAAGAPDPKEGPNNILRGTFTACSPDGKCVEIREGQAQAEGKDVAHWVENRGTTPLTYLAVEIGREP